MTQRRITIFLLVLVAVLSVSLYVDIRSHSRLQDADGSRTAAGSTPAPTSYAEVIGPVQNTVVSIYSSKTVSERVPTDPITQFFGGPADRWSTRQEEGLGSGVIVSPDGYILTNNHVVAGADTLQVLLANNHGFSAKLVGTDPKTDLAVIKINAQGLPAAVMADSDKLRVGDIVFALGNPLNVGQTVTMGVVSALGRNSLGLLENVNGYEDFIQTDAAINLGNSGGALIDARGRLVGINTAIVSNSQGSIGINFAIPSNLAAHIMRSLIRDGRVVRGYLGVATTVMTPDLAAVLKAPVDVPGTVVTEVTPGSPAAQAGLQRGDVILSANDQVQQTQADLRLLVAQCSPGDKLILHLLRDGNKVTAKVTLGQLSDQPPDPLPGVSMESLTHVWRDRLGLDNRVTGLVVTKVADDSPYADQLLAGSVIVSINRQPVGDIVTAQKLLQAGPNLLLVFYRTGYQYITLTLQ